MGAKKEENLIFAPSIFQLLIGRDRHASVVEVSPWKLGESIHAKMNDYLIHSCFIIAVHHPLWR